MHICSLKSAQEITNLSIFLMAAQPEIDNKTPSTYHVAKVLLVLFFLFCYF